MINVLKTINYIDVILPIVNVCIFIFFILSLINLHSVLKNKHNNYYFYSILSFIISLILGISLILINHYYYNMIKSFINDVKKVVDNFKLIINMTSTNLNEFYNNLKNYLSSTFPNNYVEIEQKINDIFNIFLSRYGNLLNQITNYVDIVIKMF